MALTHKVNTLKLTIFSRLRIYLFLFLSYGPNRFITTSVIDLSTHQYPSSQSSTNSEPEFNSALQKNIFGLKTAE